MRAAASEERPVEEQMEAKDAAIEWLKKRQEEWDQTLMIEHHQKGAQTLEVGLQVTMKLPKEKDAEGLWLEAVTIHSTMSRCSLSQGPQE